MTLSIMTLGVVSVLIMLAMAGPPATRPSREMVVDQSITPQQDELLRIAFDAASAFPLDPHIKNRSRAQYEVLAACFELAQPVRARDLAVEIKDWRAARAFADFAIACAAKGDQEQTIAYVATALQRAAEEEDWRRDFVRARCATAYAILGDDANADGLAGSIVDHQANTILAVRAKRVDDAQAQQLLDDARVQLIQSNNFEVLRSSFNTLVALYDRWYPTSDRRDSIERIVRSGLTRVAPRVQIEVLTDMAECALQHGDAANALECISSAQYLVDHQKWSPEDQVPLMGQMAELRARAGDMTGAGAELAAASALFKASREDLESFDRAQMILPLAQALMVMRETGPALAMYREVLVEVGDNPNSRPRADVLVDVCCSLARRNAMPDDALWSMIREMRDGLGDPW